MYVPSHPLSCSAEVKNAWSYVSSWRGGGIAPSILLLAARRKRVISFTPLLLYIEEKNTRYPVGWRIFGP
jgi:hypothetical protein